ncbi:MAG: hypothetical protein ACD_5C00291G0001 [uncultured bacterium]|nr:MAG: hypothetical protein ACD_5C00291G0001 [uncultured bacterium]
MNIKVASGIAIGLILLIGLIFGLLFFLNRETTPQIISQPISSDQNKILQVDGKINTKFGYDKSLELIKNKGDFQLVDIYSTKNPELKDFQNKIVYIFASDSGEVSTLYDYSDGTVIIKEESAKKDALAQFKGVPDSMVVFGVENVFDVLEENSDFTNYKNQNPQLFDNYMITVQHSEDFGWEWRYVVNQLEADSKPRMLVFAINPETQKVTLLKEAGFDSVSDESSQAQNSKIYKSDKYLFSLQYPLDWNVVEKDSFGGPIFMKPPLNENMLLKNGIDKNSGCAISVKSIGQNAGITIDNYCKNKLGTITFGNNVFTKCSFKDVSTGDGILSYVIKNTKSQKLLDFSPIDNDVCMIDFNKIAATLSF